jgi:hypothetical protein
MKLSSIGKLLAATSALVVSLPSFAVATTFPYSERTLDYSAWTAAIQADTNTTGMAGATVAIPSSVSSAETNPAGYAMETGSVSAQINRISITDRRIQPDGQSIDSSQWGFGISPPPWGFSISYYSPTTENATYVSPLTGDSLLTEVSLKELRFTVARSFFDSRLAIGWSAELVKAVRELGPYQYNSDALSYRVGALYRLSNHLVLGAGYAPPLTIGPNSDNVAQSELPGFNRSLLRPSQLEMGAGWIPNRFFKVGLQLSYVGDTANTALLADQTVITGASPTWVPRAGASYVLADYYNFRSELAVGTYYEPSRFEGEEGRLHATTGLEVNPYFVNLGIGFDLSKDYKNIMFGVGIDIVRTLRTFEIIPRDPTPPYQGYFPNAYKLSADGLPEAMTKGEERTSPQTSVGQVGTIIENVPGNIADKFSGKPTTVETKEKLDKHPKKSKKRKKHPILKVKPPAETEKKTE